jgi:ElaB/YqjD/DUF883 family membrane-anchored ribosome-binding protein
MANDDTARLREELDTLRGDIARLADSVKAVSEKTARAGVERARVRASQARDQVEGWADQLGSHVEERPYGSVMMAFGLGFVLGKLLDRR